MRTNQDVYSRILEAETGKFYHFPDVTEVLDNLNPDELPRTRRFKQLRYYDIPCSFDIETTSFTTILNNQEEDVGTMYEWSFGIDGYVVVGRTWDQFTQWMNLLTTKLKTSYNDRLVCYIHNHSFEFQWYSRWIKFTEVFAKSARTPLYAISSLGVEFRCSMLLTNSSLEHVGETLIRYPLKKKVGKLDYTKMRHSGTPLTSDEWSYCVSDVLVVMCLILTKIEDDGNIRKIPYTQTSYARRLCRSACLPRTWENKEDFKQYFQYKGLMKRLTLTLNEYRMARKAFAGGYTHGSALWFGLTVESVDSYDFSSSYPAVMCFEKYPMGKGFEIDPASLTRSKFEWYCKKYGCIFTIAFTNIDSRISSDYYISKSKCELLEDESICNGRVVSARKLTTTITSVDWDIIKSAYTWVSFHIDCMWCYKLDYLPRPYIETVLNLYGKKTSLKNVEGQEEEYARSKELVNALYGMMVTNIIQDGDVYDLESEAWDVDESITVESQIDDYNDDSRRFISYIWGVFVTAYARRNLWSGIFEFGKDYLYSDTDSVKVVNAADHLDYICEYNAEVDRKARDMCDHYGFDFSLTRPKTIKGVEKPLGWWDFDGHYKRFKTLGAKRYMVETDKGLSITVSGVNKRTAVPYLLSKYKTIDKCFEVFQDGLYIPPITEVIDPVTDKVTRQGAGKMIVKYRDEPFECMLEDYLGNVQKVFEYKSVYMRQGDYTLGVAGEFEEFCEAIQYSSVSLPY